MDTENRPGHDPAVEGDRPSRRRFIQGSVVGGVAVATASAIGPASLLPAAEAQSNQQGPSKYPNPDEKIIAYMETAEKVAVAIYQAATGKVTDPLATRSVEDFGSHHADQAKLLGSVLRQSDNQIEKVEPEPTLLARYQSQLDGANGQAAALEVLLGLEQVFQATYLEALAKLDINFNAQAVVSILTVDAQHATVLASLLDQPLGDVLVANAPTEGAIDLSSYSVQSAATTTTTTTAPAASSDTSQSGGTNS